MEEKVLEQSEHLLEVKDLTKEYGKDESKVTALNHISFSVEKGEFVVIL